MLVNLDNYTKVFKGSCFAVALNRRGAHDPHICFTILTEDDESWYDCGGKGSTYWIPEVIEQLRLASKWLQKNADPHEGGYSFREIT